MDRQQAARSRAFPRRTLSVVAALVVAAVLAPSGAAAAAPRVAVPEPVVDVGRVARGETIRHGFVIRNEGDAALEIGEVKPACGCTVARYDRTIAPGASGTIETEVETASFRGPIAKSVAVFTNDTGNPKISLVIKANVVPYVDVRPGYARFLAVEGERPEPVVQTLWSADRPDLAVRKVTSPFPFLQASFRRATPGESETAGTEWRIELALGADAPLGPLADYVVVETDHPREKTVRIPVSGIVRPVLSVVPRVADFGRRELDEPQLTTLEIKNLGSEAVDVTEVESDLEWVDAEIESVDEGRHYKVVLTLKPGMERGNFAGLLKISTTSSRQPVLEVTLKGTVL